MLGFEATYTGGDPHPHDRELQAVAWFTREDLRRAAAGKGEVSIPPPLAIARRLMDGWLPGRRTDGRRQPPSPPGAVRTSPVVPGGRRRRGLRRARRWRRGLASRPRAPPSPDSAGDAGVATRLPPPLPLPPPPCFLEPVRLVRPVRFFVAGLAMLAGSSPEPPDERRPGGRRALAAPPLPPLAAAAAAAAAAPAAPAPAAPAARRRLVVAAAVAAGTARAPGGPGARSAVALAATCARCRCQLPCLPLEDDPLLPSECPRRRCRCERPLWSAVDEDEDLPVPARGRGRDARGQRRGHGRRDLGDRSTPAPTATRWWSACSPRAAAAGLSAGRTTWAICGPPVTSAPVARTAAAPALSDTDAAPAPPAPAATSATRATVESPDGREQAGAAPASA